MTEDWIALPTFVISPRAARRLVAGLPARAFLAFSPSTLRFLAPTFSFLAGPTFWLLPRRARPLAATVEPDRVARGISSTFRDVLPS